MRIKTKAFTIVELLVVIAIIGILAAISIVAYNGVQQSARDKALLSDIDNVESELTRYSLKNGGVFDPVLDWNSSEGDNVNIPFVPSPGNIIVVTVSGEGYCIKAYNPDSNAKTFASAFKKGGGEIGCSIGWNTVGVGDSYVCATASDRNAYCWGTGTGGQLGQGSYTSSNVPVAVITSGVLAGKTIKKLTVGPNFTCGIASDDNVYCWGSGSQGQLGHGIFNASNVPVAVSTSGELAGKTIKQLALGNAFACAIASDDNAYCWGFGTSGQLGNGVSANSNVPVAVTTSGVLAGKTIKKLVAGAAFACVIASDDNVYCWGTGINSQLGNGVTANSNVPVAVTTSGVLAGKTVQDLDLGNNYACAIASDRNAYCWGTGTSGQLASGGSGSSNVPVAMYTSGLLSGKTIKQIITAGSLVCMIASDNNPYCSGGGTAGQLGAGVSTNAFLPVAVITSGVLAGKTLTKIFGSQITSGGNPTAFLCALASDNNAYCWGTGTAGQLGNGILSNSNVPVAVTTSGVLAGKTIKQLAVGFNFSCAIASDRNAYCWGTGYSGQLGNGTADTSEVPVLVTLPAGL